MKRNDIVGTVIDSVVRSLPPTFRTKDVSDHTLVAAAAAPVGVAIACWSINHHWLPWVELWLKPLGAVVLGAWLVREALVPPMSWRRLAASEGFADTGNRTSATASSSSRSDLAPVSHQRSRASLCHAPWQRPLSDDVSRPSVA